MRILPSLLLLLAALVSAAAEKKPDIVLILADDLGAGDLGCTGGTQAETPHLDRLAREGTRFTRYYSAAPICSPSRCGWITGQHPARWRITSYLQTRAGNRACGQADFLDPAAPTLPRALRAAGYATAHVGKWHLGGGRDVTNAPPFAAYGYDLGVGTYESPEPHPDITATDWIWSAGDRVKRWDRTAFFVDQTLAFFARHPERPRFVNLWLDDPHTPWVPADDAPKGDLPRNLRPVLEENDRQIGRLLAGLPPDTLVLYASDNGPLPTFQQKRTLGLRGSKLGLYEGGIRLPLIVKWPGRVPAGRVDETSVISGLDLFPTLCALAGAPLPAGYAPDGEDRSAVWRGTPGPRQKPLFWEYGRNETSFKYPPDRSPNLALLEGDWKLLRDADGRRVELYNLATDPGEKDNRAESQPERVADQSRALLEWRKSMP